ncbi:hypothetical protein [Chryseobacterium gossypii]|uniref:hypothetical protein n=1 Tax=Chryseobacterium gossypii TaxID=3231602 RepID=UPI003526761F
MKNHYLLILFWGVFTYAQIGVNTPNPTSSLTVNGSFEADYKEITANSYNITSTDYYLTYSGTSNTTFTLPPIGAGTNSFTGRIYKIKNVSTSTINIQASDNNTIRVDNTPVAVFAIPPSAYAEVVNNSNATGGTWDLSFVTLPRPSNVEIYGAQLMIPPHGFGNPGVADWSNHSNTAYDSGTGTNTWWIISKSSTSYSHTLAFANSSRMTIVYEYQGPPFNITNMYPILTAGNNSNFPDVFTTSFVSLTNNGTAGRTRLTVSVARVDFIGNNTSNNSNSNWTGTFLLNLLLTRKVF